MSSPKINSALLISLVTEINPRAANRGLNPATNLFDIGALDSYSIVQLVLSLEEKLEINFNFNDVMRRHFRSVSRLKKLLVRKYGCEDTDQPELPG